MLVRTTLFWVKIVFTHLLALASGIALFWRKEAVTNFDWLLAVTLALACLAAVISDLVEHHSTATKLFSNDEQIKAYMSSWLSHSGRTAIFSRNLSWVDAKQEQRLIALAKSGDLVVCAGAETELVKRLAKAGAEVFTYGDKLEAPAARFTIVNFERADAKVAVGRATARGHEVLEIVSNEHPITAVATDLVKMVRKVGTRLPA